MPMTHATVSSDGSFQSCKVVGKMDERWHSYQNSRYASSSDFSVPAQITLSLALTSQHKKLQSVLFSPANFYFILKRLRISTMTKELPHKML